MKIQDVLRLKDLHGYVAGTQATTPDSRSADQWIKNYLDAKNKRLNDLRQDLLRVKGKDPEPIYKSDADELEGSWQVYKPSITMEQHPEKVASGGEWCVTDPDGLIISTWPTQKEAEHAAFALWKGIAPSSTGATAGARVKRTRDVVADQDDDVTDDFDREKKYKDIFQDQKHGDRTRARFIKHKKPKAVQLADMLRTGDLRPSSHGGGAAGTGGTGGPSGGSGNG